MNELRQISVPADPSGGPSTDASGDASGDPSAEGRAALRYRVWPAQGDTRATVGLFNGIMSHSAWFDPLSGPLVDAGFKLVGVDRRGSGMNKDGWGDAASASTLVEDALAVLAAEHDPSLPLFLVGWCWGAALSLAVGNKVSADLRGVALVTPGMFNRAELHTSIAQQLELHADAEPGASVLDSPIKDTMFTASAALDGFVRADEHRVMTISRRLLSLTKKLATGATIRLRKTDLPTLVVLAEEDEATDNEATRRFFDKLPPQRVQVVTVPGRHGVQFDAPAETSAHLRTFFERILEQEQEQEQAQAQPAEGGHT